MQTVSVDVKVSATVNSGNFSGMRCLSDTCEDRSALGLVLYDHDNTVLFGSGCSLLYLYFLDWKLNLI